MANAGKKILVADDSALVAAMLSNMLKGAGYDVARAADGIEATQKAYSEMPDLILLDIFMPRMNGYQVCRLLKNDSAVSHIPVIILTGSDSTSAEFWSLQTGADAFMTKGFEPPELLGAVDRLLTKFPTGGKEPQPAPAPEEILSQVSILIDRELYHTTVERLELQTVLRNLHDGIVRVDMQRNISSVNRALCQMLGEDEAALVGKPAEGALGPGAGAVLMGLYNRAVAGQSGPPEDTEVRSRDGSVTPVAIAGELLCDYNNQPVGCVFLVQDITRRKQIESMVEQLKALDKMKNDLTA
jgi:twitching motility two-component system response regulator PilH